MQRLEAAPRAALADHVPGRDGGRDALQLVLAEIGALEQRMDQLAGRGADHHAVGLGDPLQPRREVGGLADHRMPALRPAALKMAWIRVEVVVLPSVPVTPTTCSLREGKSKKAADRIATAARSSGTWI